MTDNQNHLLSVVFPQFPAEIVNSSYRLFVAFTVGEGRESATHVLY